MAVSVLVLIVALYSTVGTAYLEARRRREPPPVWARWLGFIAVLAHFAGLAALASEHGRSPFATGAEALTFLSFSLAAIYLLLESTTRVDPHGGSFYLLAAILAALGVPGLVEATNQPPVQEARESIRTWHVGIGLLSAAAVLVGGLLATGYLGSYFRVKQHKLATESGGLALSSFGRLTRNATFVSVVLLGVAVALGLSMSLRDDAPRGIGFLTVTMACVLLLLLCAWFIWWRRPVRGALAAWLNVGGVVLMAISIAVVHPLVIGAS